MNIGEASAASGVSSKMIRYYEDIGLLRPAARNAAGYRVYSQTNVHELNFVRRARDLGFTIEQIAELVGLWRDSGRASADVKRIAVEHIQVLETKLTEIQEMTAALKHLVSHCHGNHRPDCPIIEELAASGTVSRGVASRSSLLGKGFKNLR
ncbi:MAG: Cu(I)-responsive transcriptional regulator [Hyphomicrobiales bacterium]|nr:Cu(I)-responsive transcriptional regulator [Hyphomicrobiales bacterium]